MTGICGWVGAVPSGAAETTMAAMGRALPPVTGQFDESLALPRASVLIRGWPGCVSLHRDEGLIAALVGEAEWSDPEMAALARQHGHAVALATAWQAHGMKLFSRLHGPFSFAILCPRTRTALLAVDRMGIHGMCYACPPGGGLVFGATADSVNAHPAVSGTITPQTVFTFLQLNLCPAPSTIYQEMSKLRSAHYLRFDGTLAQAKSYWTMPYREDGGDDQMALTEEMHALLRSSVGKVVESSDRARIGAFLSGGLDSSTVCGLFSETGPGPTRSFTITFDDPKYDESEYAAICARRFGLEAHTHTLSIDDAASFIERLAAAYDEPFGNSSAIPAYYCARMAVDHGVSTMLAGDGGDEIFAGNERYVEHDVYEKYAGLPASFRRFMLSPLIGALGRLDGIDLFRRAAGYVRLADTPLPDRLYGRHPMWGNDRLALFSRWAAAEIVDSEASRTLRASFDAIPSASRVQRMMNFDLQVTLADNDLRKVVRMCELAGCRVRFPLLDEKLVEFAARIPTRVLLDGGRLRGFYKSAMTGFLPGEILAKTKHGFGMPFDAWTREPGRIRDLVCDSLGSLAARDIFDPGAIHALVDAHRADRPSPWRDLVWDLMTLELWWQSREGAAAHRPARAAGKRAAVS
jgi:asparagine synthase (glutamine-hydrolysing)